MKEEVKKVDLITLLRTFKKEGLDNFIVIRKEKFENNFIPKSRVKDKIEELKKKVEELTDEKGYWGGSDLLEQIKVLQDLLERSMEDE